MRFQTELGVLSGPGANEGDEWANALLISAASGSRWSLKGRRIVWGTSTGLHGKKCSSRAVLSSSGAETLGSSGKRGGGRPMPNCFAVQTVWGVAVVRNAHQ